MIPVVSPGEMRAIDEAAPEPVDELIERAGAALARVALDMLGGAYGRRVVVVAGKGNNGADGRAAGRRLARRGIRVEVFDAAGAPARLPRCDLVIDAAYGTGFRGTYDAPDAGDALVLSADIPSGTDGLTGERSAGASCADATVTFAALKPGILLAGDACGVVTVADIGLDVSGASSHLIEAGDVRLPAPDREAHKYAAGVGVVAGSPGMTGAPSLCAGAAFRAGSGYVAVATPGGIDASFRPVEAVTTALPVEGWATPATDSLRRMRAVAVGPGLGRRETTLAEAASFLDAIDVPAVIDGDGLRAVGRCRKNRSTSRSWVLTPHEGEFEYLAGEAPGADRLGSVRALAATQRCHVLLKGPVTIVAGPDGSARFVTSGGTDLATAGTGDVLTGIVAAFLSQGLPPLDAASWAADVHGRAAARASRGSGLLASDLIDQLPGVLWPGR